VGASPDPKRFSPPVSSGGENPGRAAPRRLDMAVIVDCREHDETLRAGADRVEPLRVDGTAYSYDLRVECDDGTAFRLERKTFGDFVWSWRKGTLERQLSYVDGLVLEMDGLDPESDLHRAALKHLSTISANLWVVVSASPAGTIELLRYFERRGCALTVRQGAVSHRARTTREALLSTLPRINPARLGAALEALVDWEALVDALHLERWTELPAIGKGTIERVRAALAQSSERSDDASSA
jgi:ERCC4-type nuclease